MNVAVLGLGFMGSTHLKAWRAVEGVRIAAIMSSDERKLAGDLTAIEGNLGISGEQMDFSAVRKYRSVDAALADPAIDAVDICLPTDRHAPVAIAALRAGKHTLVEKPLALDSDQAQSVLREAEDSGRILMAAQVLRFFPTYRKAAEHAKQGKLYSAFFRRRCAAPAWGGWLGDPARSGGGFFDLLIHDADFCISLWGMPDSVRATGHESLSEGVDIVHAELNYRGLGPVIVTGGWHHPKSYPFSMEFTVVTDSGTMEWSSANARGLELFAANGEASTIPLDDTDPFAAELGYFAECVRKNRKPDLCRPEQSAQAVALMRYMLESRRRNGDLISCRH